MTAEEVLDEVLEALERYDIPYMVTGSYASNLHGLPRATLDGDVVIHPAEANLPSFVRSLQETYYADEIMAVDALQRRFMFNVLHLASTFKVDLIITAMARNGRVGTAVGRCHQRHKAATLGDGHAVSSEMGNISWH